jgi:hypothetical protein
LHDEEDHHVSVDQKALLKDLQRQVRSFEDDIRRRVNDDADSGEALRSEHAKAVELGRTATSFAEWRDGEVTQAAVAWVLASVFVRFCEDNGLVDEPWLSGPGERRRVAGERETAWLLKHSDKNDRDWLLASFDHLAGFPSMTALFDSRHNALHRLHISADGAEALVGFWRRTTAEGEIVHDFADVELSTRFLGDLYQNLSEAARKQYALLQTPEFVEELILDLTLDPAIETFGLEGLRLIDPTCGSGHFLLGAFQRLLDRWGREKPGMDLRERVQASLGSIHGVDINPFASAIALFRLTVAALKASGLKRFADAPGYDLHIATGDSLLYEQGRQGEFFDTALGEHQYASEDLAEHPDILKPGRYHVVVGNPPYIQPSDKALNEAYRKGYPGVCRGKYQLTAPFADLFFRLAIRDDDRPGLIGQITSNGFMSREFGRPLIEDFFPTVELTHVLDTSKAEIPGHGTPTVILVGKRRHPRMNLIRAALGVRAESPPPAEPKNGRVWESIVLNLGSPGYEDDYISIVDIDRGQLAKHPWSLSGGGAKELMEHLRLVQVTRLGDRVSRIGFFGVIGADDAMIATDSQVRRIDSSSRELYRPLVLGDAVRDWGIRSADPVIFPYDSKHKLIEMDHQTFTYRLLWTLRTELGNRATFSGNTYFQEGRPWYEWHQLPPDEGLDPRAITFAFVATHNHFVFDREHRAFNRSAPIMKFRSDVVEEDYLAILGLLNSSLACFWLKQVSYDKGTGGEAWERRIEITGTKLQEFPMPREAPVELARQLDDLSHRLKECDLDDLSAQNAPTRASLDDTRRQHASVRAEMVSLQEELDWAVYQLYGLVDEDLTYHGTDLPGLAFGERAFEILMARQMGRGGDDVSAWFDRHGGRAITDAPKDWPKGYADLCLRRHIAMQENPYLRLIERPECKRRWAAESWDAREAAALRNWLLDRLERAELWRDNAGRPQPQSVAQLADRLASDADFLSVLDVWTGHSGSDVVKELGRLLAEEHVPHLAAIRYKEPGLRVRAEWESTWDLQRREDAGERVGLIPVPPKYKPLDFVKTSFWKHRGKLDVPKERFISYLGAERGADTSLVLGWAGWDHAEQALALAGLALNRAQADGWGADRLTPLWAGVVELEPWVKQWHSEVDSRMGISPAQAVTATLDRELSRLGLTREDLAAWRPEPSTRGRRSATKEG